MTKGLFSIQILLNRLYSFSEVLFHTYTNIPTNLTKLWEHQAILYVSLLSWSAFTAHSSLYLIQLTDDQRF